MASGTAEQTDQATSGARGESITPPVVGAGLDGKEGGAESQPEKTYRQAEVDAMLGKAGQRIQAKMEAITAERDQYKSQVGSLTTEITEAKESIGTLTEDIRVMSDDDPAKGELVKRRRYWEAEVEKLKKEKTEIADSRHEITQWKRDQLVYTVADEFVTAGGGNVDLDSFKKAADKFKLSGREELETLAETMGFKPKDGVPEEVPQPQTPPIRPYSGRTEGGKEPGPPTAKGKIRAGWDSLHP